MATEHAGTARARIVPIRLWVWTTIWVVNLLGARNWAQVVIAALWLRVGFKTARTDGSL